MWIIKLVRQNGTPVYWSSIGWTTNRSMAIVHMTNDRKPDGWEWERLDPNALDEDAEEACFV